MDISFCAPVCIAGNIFNARFCFSTPGLPRRFAIRLADKLRSFDCDAVISPALGGIIVGQEVGRSLGKRHIFVEKEAGGLALRRGFKIDQGEKFIVAEDVVTRGGRVQETIDIVRCTWRDRLCGRRHRRSKRKERNRNFGCPFVSLIEIEMETFRGG